MTHGGTLDDLGHRSNGGARDTGCCFPVVQNMTKDALPPACPSQAPVSIKQTVPTTDLVHQDGRRHFTLSLPKKNESKNFDKSKKLLKGMGKETVAQQKVEEEKRRRRLRRNAWRILFKKGEMPPEALRAEFQK